MMKNIFYAIELVLFRPVMFFENIRQKSKPSVNVFIFFWTVTPVVTAIDAYQSFLLSAGHISERLAVVLFVAKILQAILNIVVMSGVFHLILKLLKGTGKYMDTLSACIYGYSGTHIFNTIYGAGPFIRVLWMTVVLIVGFKILHAISYKKASLIVISLMVLGFIVSMTKKDDLEQKLKETQMGLLEIQHDSYVSPKTYPYNQTLKKV